jgi:hypothetical protein
MRYRHKQLHNPHKNVQALPEHIIEQRLQGAQLVNPTPPLSAGALEAKQILEKANQLKGNTMPDIQTALKTALENTKRAQLHTTLEAWEQDEKETQLEKPMTIGKTNLFNVTNNVTRATFNYVRDNPGVTATQVVQGLSNYNKTSVHSLVAQFVNQNQFSRGADGTLRTINAEYQPLKSTAKLRKELAAKRAAEKQQEASKRKIVLVKRRTAEDVAHAQAAAGIGALTVNAEVDGRKIGTFTQHAPWKPEDTVDQLTLVQAKAVYVYLQKVFGGN